MSIFKFPMKICEIHEIFGKFPWKLATHVPFSSNQLLLARDRGDEAHPISGRRQGNRGGLPKNVGNIRISRGKNGDVTGVFYEFYLNFHGDFMGLNWGYHKI